MISTIFSCLCIVLLQNALAIDIDYYNSPATLRSPSLLCDQTLRFDCGVRCGLGKPLCLYDKCFCVTVEYQLMIEPVSLPIDSSQETSEFHETEETDSGYVQDDEEPLTQTISEHSSSDADRSPLRHHIAHFCPNLDVARECIKKCMPLGKPAFCGKDHVCYCGHKYSNNDVNKKGNAEEIYADFKDMYKAYFGTDVIQDSESAEVDTKPKKSKKNKRALG